MRGSGLEIGLGIAEWVCVCGAVMALSFSAYRAGMREALAEILVETGDAGEHSRARTVLRLLIVRAGRLGAPLLGERQRTRLKRDMIMGGLDMRDSLLRTPQDFMGLQLLAMLGFGLAGLYVVGVLHKSPLYVTPALALGFVLPRLWLRDQIKVRHLLITRALPYNLDLLTLSVEAGLDFVGALNKVVERGKKGPLLDELGLVLRQLKMGKTRADSLKTMMERVNLGALSMFVSAIVQADKMGSPLGRILRIQSQQLRVERTQRAEKLANEAPVKMLMPLIFCIFPTVFLIIFAPIAFQFTSNP